MIGRWRWLAAIGLLILLGLTSAAKLVQLQVVQHGAWLQTADGFQVHEVIQSQPRGEILDRNGIVLASNVRATSIALDNYHMTRPELLQPLLTQILGLSDAQATKLIYRPSYFTWLARKVDPSVAATLKQKAELQGIHGLIFLPEWKRVYPQGSLASNLIGFAGLDNTGLEGLELEFNQQLSGQNEERAVVRGADGTVLSDQQLKAGQPGDTLTLTIDARIQRIAEQAVQAGVSSYRAKAGFAIVMDPHNGDVLAMAQDKTYNLNDFSHSTPEERQNIAVTTTFEPGSTFKPFAMLPSLVDGAIQPGDTVSGDEPVVVAGHAIHNAEYISYGPVTPTQIIAESINTGMIRVAMKLGAPALSQFLTEMRFGQPTGIQLPGEVNGLLRPLKDWSGLAIGSIPIGQGISVTGIQLATAYGAIADGGTLLSPHIVQSLGPPNGKPQAVQLPTSETSTDGTRIASPQQVSELVSMMEQVVASAHGTGIYARIPGFNIAAKSGTGQKAVPGQGYVSGKYTSLFSAFFPANNPQYLILVVLDEVGQKDYYGGLTAGPIFKQIAEGIIQLEQLPPDQPVSMP